MEKETRYPKNRIGRTENGNDFEALEKLPPSNSMYQADAVPNSVELQ